MGENDHLRGGQAIWQIQEVVEEMADGRAYLVGAVIKTAFACVA